jgi:LmbE family N-acetylglucosaminyl deacetylase
MMTKTKNLLAVVLLGSLLTVWGCGDAAEGSNGPEVPEPLSALVVVIAHPDDEVTFGPLLGHYAKQGVEVYLVCVTSGQQGTGNNDIPAGDELAAVREAEITAAAVQYGINPPRLLQFQDGQLDSLSDEEIADLKTRVRDVLEDVGAQIVITFGPDGMTGHADHIAVGAITTELVAEMQAEAKNERAPDKLYHTMFPESFEPLLSGVGDFVFVPDSEATTIIDARDGIAEAQAAMMEYVSQFPPAMMEQIRLLATVFAPAIPLRWILAKDGQPQGGETDIFD